MTGSGIRCLEYGRLSDEIISEHDKIELPGIKPFIERHR
jgi:hypothetical protein